MNECSWLGYKEIVLRVLGSACFPHDMGGCGMTCVGGVLHLTCISVCTSLHCELTVWHHLLFSYLMSIIINQICQEPSQFLVRISTLIILLSVQLWQEESEGQHHYEINKFFNFISGLTSCVCQNINCLIKDWI